MKKLLSNFNSAAARLHKDESGKLEALAWTLGATVVTVLVIVLLMRIMPQTTEGFFGAATQWLRTSFGF